MATAKKAPKKRAEKSEARTVAEAQAEPRQSTELVKAVMEELNITGEDREKLKERVFAVLASQAARNHAIAMLCGEGAALLKAVVKVVTNHGEIINELVGLSLVKRRNDTKSKLGNAPNKGEPPQLPPGKAQQHHRKFRDGQSRQQRPSGPPQIPDKQPIGTNLGDKLRAAGIATEPAAAPQDAPVDGQEQPQS